MAFKDNLNDRVAYFRKSVRLDSLATENDPEYNYSDSDLMAILEYSSQTIWGTSTKDVPLSNFTIVLMMSKLEIYYRLATTSAPFYPISAEGASLQKDKRFEHYEKLIKLTKEQFDSLWEIHFGKGGKGGNDDEEDETGTGGVVTSYGIKLDYIGTHYRKANSNLRTEIPIELLDIEYDEGKGRVIFEWSNYDNLVGSAFDRYEVYADKEEIIDLYDPEAKLEKKPLYIMKDTFRTMAMLPNVEKGDTVYVLIIVRNRDGEEGYVYEEYTIPKDEEGEDGQTGD